MSYQPEQMTIDVAKSLLNCAYNDITFKNALLCTLDWCNWHHCVYLHKDTEIPVDSDGKRISRYEVVSIDDHFETTEDQTIVSGKSYFEKVKKNKYTDVTLTLDPSTNPSEHYPALYEYVNPSEQDPPWFEHIRTDYNYTQIPSTELSYNDNPYMNGWYEKDEHDNYVKSREQHATGDFNAVVDPEPYRNPKELKWYELTEYNYQKVDTECYFNPKALGLYERTGTSGHYVYTLSEDTFYYGATKTYYEYDGTNEEYVVFAPSPRSEGWYEYNVGLSDYVMTTDSTIDFTKDYYDFLGDDYTPTYDTSPVSGKTYYICDFNDYYKQYEQNVDRYDITTDTIVNPTKIYYTAKNPADWRSLPDYSDKYVRNISIDVPGIENEITLYQKRPTHLGG